MLKEVYAARLNWRVWHWIEYQQLKRGHLREKQQEGRKLSGKRNTVCSVNKRSVMPEKEVNKREETEEKKRFLPTEPSSQKESWPTYFTSASFSCLVLFSSIHPFFSFSIYILSFVSYILEWQIKAALPFFIILVLFSFFQFSSMPYLNHIVLCSYI